MAIYRILEDMNTRTGVLMLRSVTRVRAVPLAGTGRRCRTVCEPTAAIPAVLNWTGT